MNYLMRIIKIKLLIIGNHFNLDPAKGLRRNNKKGIIFLGKKTNPIDYLLNSDLFYYLFLKAFKLM